MMKMLQRFIISYYEFCDLMYLSIISKVENYEIFYNLSEIDIILQEWERRNHKNISDHKPIMARIDIV